MANYDGYLPSSEKVVDFNWSFSENLRSGFLPNSVIVLPDFRDNVSTVIKLDVIPLIANYSAPPIEGFLVTATSQLSNDFREEIYSNIIRMDTVPYIADYTLPVLPTIKERIGTMTIGLLATAEYQGVLSSGNETEIRYIYRTVGSPRRYPLDISWNKSKSEETIIIDEVDGDVDE